MNSDYALSLIDDEGYLTDLSQWSEAFCIALAAADKFNLTQQHWEVIFAVREFYQQYDLSPAMRPLVKTMQDKYGSEKGKSMHLMKLFSQSPPKQAARYAGLPKPLNCL